MSPQPIDAPSMMGRMAVADHAQHVAERQAVVQQERLAVETPAQSTQKQTQVQHADETEHTRVRERRRRKEPFSGRRRRRKRRGRGKSAAPEHRTLSDPSTYNPSAEKETAATDEGNVIDLKA